jgi:hypothetical protein
VILLNYYSVSLAEHVSATAFGSAAALCVFCALLGLVIRILTKDKKMAYAVAVVLAAAVWAAYILNSEAFEGLLPNIMKKISLFERFYTFVSGVFDLTAIIYYITVIVFFLFLSVQSLEKRRYN